MSRLSTTDLEAGVSRKLAAYRTRTLGDLRYDFRLSVPAAPSEPVRGSVILRFRRTDPDDGPLVLDFVEPAERIRSVSLLGSGGPEEGEGGDPRRSPAGAVAREISVDFAHDHVVIPGEALPRLGPVELRLDFEAGDASLNRNEDYLYTLFVPDRAHFALPVFDQPDLKARFRLELEVPEGWRATSNGAVLGVEEPGPSGRTSYRFAETEPIPTYLFAFVAGRFERVEARRNGRSFAFHHRETDSARVGRNLDELFDLHATAIEWLEEYTGAPDPFGDFGFVAVPGFQYNGMEHPGAIYYRASSLFLDESTTQAELLGRASVIAHETAHLWFGDLVTMEWFDDVWMKEVFANFMAAKIVHPSFPELNHDLRFFLSHHPAAYSVDRSGGTHAIRQELENLGEAGSLYGPIIYQKAPVVMRQLELLLGEEALRDGLREYLDAYRFGNASWPDLVEILDRRSPVDVTAWSRIWVEEAGRPLIRATVELRGTDAEPPVAGSSGPEPSDGEVGPGGDGAASGPRDPTPPGPVIDRLVVAQEDPAGQGRIWPQTLHVVLGYGNDSTVALPVRLLEARAELEAARGLPRPDWVLPGGRGLGYARFPLDPTSRGRLLETLPRIADPLVRGVGWVSLWEELLDGTVDPEPLMVGLLEAVEREEVELNLQRVLGYLGSVWWRVFDDGQRERWASRVEEALWSGLQGGAPPTHRASILRAYRSMAVTPEGVDRLRALWAGDLEIPDLPLSEEDRTALASELAVRGAGVRSAGGRAETAGAVEELLDRQMESIENPDRRERFRFIRPSLSADPAVRDAFFQSLRDEEARSREPWVATAVSNLHHPLRAEHGRRFIRPSLELLEDIRRTGDIFFVTSWLDATLWGHSSPEAAATVRDFLAERPGYPQRIRQKILQSADLLFRVADRREGRE